MNYAIYTAIYDTLKSAASYLRRQDDYNMTDRNAVAILNNAAKQINAERAECWLGEL